jgi:hypothetical protein
MENNVLIIDDKISRIGELKGSSNQSEKIEGENLNQIVYGVRNNDLTPIFLSDFSDLQGVQNTISELKNVKGIVLDLNLNSIDGADVGDKELIEFLLKNLKKKFGKFFVFVFSSVADQWEELSEQIEEDVPDLKPLLKSSNVRVLEKGQNKEGVIFSELQALYKSFTNKESLVVILEAKKTLIKNWIVELVLVGFFLSILNLACLGLFPSKVHSLVIQICIVLIVGKSIDLELKRIEALKKYTNYNDD